MHITSPAPAQTWVDMKLTSAVPPMLIYIKLHHKRVGFQLQWFSGEQQAFKHSTLQLEQTMMSGTKMLQSLKGFHEQKTGRSSDLLLDGNSLKCDCRLWNCLSIIFFQEFVNASRKETSGRQRTCSDFLFSLSNQTYSSGNQKQPEITTSCIQNKEIYHSSKRLWFLDC